MQAGSGRGKEIGRKKEIYHIHPEPPINRTQQQGEGAVAENERINCQPLSANAWGLGQEQSAAAESASECQRYGSAIAESGQQKPEINSRAVPGKQARQARKLKAAEKRIKFTGKLRQKDILNETKFQKPIPDHNILPSEIRQNKTKTLAKHSQKCKHKPQSKVKGSNKQVAKHKHKHIKIRWIKKIVSSSLHNKGAILAVLAQIK